MILTKEVEIKLNQFNSHYYKRIGYDVDGKELINIDIKDIGKGTMVKIKVKCEICGREKEIGYRKYFKNCNKYNVYSCSNKCSMFKNRKSNMEKYGVEHQCQDKVIASQIISTKIEKGLISTSSESFTDYRRIVNNLTNINKKELYKLWNGEDYYDGEYIKDNLNLDFNDKKYPTIDHKISVFYGFKNNIDVIEISSITNLCITKRSNNSSKSFKTEEEYAIKNL